MSKIKLIKSDRITISHNAFIEKFDIDKVDTEYFDFNSENKYRNNLNDLLSVSKNEAFIIDRINELDVLRSNELDWNFEKEVIDKIVNNNGEYMFLQSEINPYSYNTKNEEKFNVSLESALEFPNFIDEKITKTLKNTITDVANRKGLKIANRLRNILVKYYDRISVSKFDKGVIEGFEYEINLKPDTEPVWSHPYNTSPPEQKVIDETIDVLLKAGIIERYDGAWGAPVIVIKNNDGSLRLCVDYSRRNAVTIHNNYPCPNIHDKLAEFQGKKIFSTFDITKAFHNIKVKESHKERSAFVTKKGTFVWNYMPFGGKNCPATWARASDWVFRNVKGLIKYVDDIALANVDDESHIQSIKQFFETLAEANLKIKLSKCEFFKSKIKYVGHMVSAAGIEPVKSYIKNVLQLGKPKNKPECMSYCGFVGWLNKYCFGLKQALQPISKLNRKNVRYDRGPEQDIAFHMIQQIIDNADILAMPDWNKSFYLWVDACDNGYGAVLMQKDSKDQLVPIEFVSRVWGASESRNWPTSTKELAALMRVCEKWERYLGYRKVYIHGDAKNVEWLMKRIENRGKKTNKMHYHMAYKLKPFEYEVQHIPGVQNIVADYLSRYTNFRAIAIQMMNGMSDGYESRDDSDEALINDARFAGQAVGNPEQIVAGTEKYIDCERIKNENEYQKHLRDSGKVFASYDSSLIKTKTKKVLSGKRGEKKPKLYLLHNSDYKWEKCVIFDENVSESMCAVRTLTDMKLKMVLKDNVSDYKSKYDGQIYLMRNYERGKTLPCKIISDKINFQKQFRNNKHIQNSYLTDLNNKNLFILSKQILDEQQCVNVTNKNVKYMQLYHIDYNTLYPRRRQQQLYGLRRSQRIANQNQSNPNDLSLRNVNKNKQIPNYTNVNALRDMNMEDTPSIENHNHSRNNGNTHNTNRHNIQNRDELLPHLNTTQYHNDAEPNANNTFQTEIDNDIDYGFAYEYELLADHLGNNSDIDFMFDMAELLRSQKNAPFLGIVRRVLNRGTDRDEYWLPPKMKSDLKRNKYFISSD